MFKVAYDGEQQDKAAHACFLCVLDPAHTCHIPQLEGRLFAAYERNIEGTRTPVMVLDTGTTHAEVQLEDQYYRGLIKELTTRGERSDLHHLTLRIYHLPTSPSIVEDKSETGYCYRGNSYSLAVLEPDTLLNITDLNQAAYCPRQYMLSRLSPSPTSAETIRGNLVHYCFKELLKEHDRGTCNGHTAEVEDTEHQAETPRHILHRHLEQALHLNSIDMALANVSVDAIRADVMPHLESLAHWYESESSTLWDLPTAYADSQAEEQGNRVRAETFLLAPEIGLRGRLDLFWQQAGRQRLLELKTGGASGNLPKSAHSWQVHGYHALLAVRHTSQMKRALATLLYSGTPGKAQAFGIPSTIRDIQRVNETRNKLILSRITGIAPAPPGPTRCTKCAMLQRCQNVSSLLGWQAPEPDLPQQGREADSHKVLSENHRVATGLAPVVWEARQGQALSLRAEQWIDTSIDREFFVTYYSLLQLEGLAGEQQQALLWKTPMVERIASGTAISGLDPIDAPGVEKDGWTQTFRCHNISELRAGDEILLSNGNPITGEVVTGTLLALSATQVTVWTRELIASPTLIDRYDNDLVHVRTLQNLLRWLQADIHVRDLVAGKVRPRFLDKSVVRRADFNSEQNLAIERAMQMQDYLLIHGPPGTGKTSVIAEIIQRFCQQGQRVMLAAFTNQAVDTMLKRLEQEGFHEYLRLGHERSVNDAVQHRLLGKLVAHNSSAYGGAGERNCVYELLQTTPVVATTTATWSSDKYTLATMQGEDVEKPGLHFDVAIIDEAGQLTVPAILGALRFAKRFILVGDEKQLPPLVLSKEAAERGLANSLFGIIKQWDDNYLHVHPMAMSACVYLHTQYRMNKWIGHFASTVFYEKQLLAHESIANRRLAFDVSATHHLSFQDDAPIIKAIDPAFPLVFLDVNEAGDNLAPCPVGRERGEKKEFFEGTPNPSREGHPLSALSPESSCAPTKELKRSDAEARAVRALVAALLARGIAQQDIGIIALYRAQVATIRRHLFSSDATSGWQALAQDTPMSIDTVDRFQGGERMVIIISFATQEEPGEYSQRREFLTDPHRLNVALTRAQRKLILVGSVAALERLPTFQRLITYCRSMKTLIIG